MHKIIVALFGVLLLVGCTNTEKGATAGGLIAGGAVAAAGGNSGQIALGALGGAAAGALIGRSTERRGYCIYRDRRGRRYEARCR